MDMREHNPYSVSTKPSQIRFITPRIVARCDPDFHVIAGKTIALRVIVESRFGAIENVHQVVGSFMVTYVSHYRPDFFRKHDPWLGDLDVGLGEMMQGVATRVKKQQPDENPSRSRKGSTGSGAKGLGPLGHQQQGRGHQEQGEAAPKWVLAQP